MDPRTQQVSELLVRTARNRETISYHAVAQAAGLSVGDPGDRAELAQLLAAISTAEHERGRPMLSAVVVLGGRGVPGEGFFQLARELGRFSGSTREEKVAFHGEEVRRVYEAWGERNKDERG